MGQKSSRPARRWGFVDDEDRIQVVGKGNAAFAELCSASERGPPDRLEELLVHHGEALINGQRKVRLFRP